jgi:hypothetical protein
MVWSKNFGATNKNSNHPESLKKSQLETESAVVAGWAQTMSQIYQVGSDSFGVPHDFFFLGSLVFVFLNPKTVPFL